ncbi:MAG: alpha/beta fold hydrolase [Gammaproteobacteria bacterium]|nr:alpha/beta fold hydrolase [Gammaproteobacteria bacterium]
MSGRGKVTMLFASGTGLPSTIWSQANLTTAVSHVAKTFTYDRLYTFNSCANKNNYLPNTAIDVVHRLHRFLQQQQIKPPYILVGHSFGGLYMLLYAKLYPQQVAGLLLLDPTSSAGPTPLPKKALPILRRVGNPQNPTPTNPLYNELIGQYPSYLQVANAPPLERKIPLIVMYATKHCLPKGITQSSVPYCMTAKQEHNHFLEQKKIYNMSDYHKIIRVNGEHNSFFTHEKHSQMVKAFDEIMTMAKPRAKLLAKAYRD